jgi:steroid 5-alpha reductase family enzyme
MLLIMKQFILYILTSLVLSAGVMVPFAGGILPLAGFVTGADMLMVVSLCALGFAIASFAFGIITKDYSWIDRIYSILPVCFAWYYAYRGGFAPAPCIGAVLVTFWGARLTFNFARKGGYNGVEDYRWPVMRQKIPNPFLWQFFNLSFISLFQSALFVLFTYPIYSLTFYTAESLPALFWVFIVLGIALVCLEFTADQQQWNFHKAKKSAAEQKDYPPKYSGDVKNGFLSQGLFSASRHPNYFCELGFWWTIWLTAFSLARHPIVSGLFGPAVLTLVMIGSTILAESISSSKYPEYKNYKRKVSPIIPWFQK